MPLLDSENIFPKRLGLMNGNQVILEYYNFAIDKFKKHAIPFDSSLQPKIIIEQIYKDPKHIPYLKKVDPKTLRSVIEGHRVPSKRQAPLQQKQSNFRQFYEQPQKNNNSYSKPTVKQPSYEYQQQERNETKHQHQQPSQIKAHVKQPQKKEQVDQYYGEQFQSFQISQSFDKKIPTINSFSNIDKSKSQDIKSSVSKSERDSFSSETSKKTVEKVEQPASKKGKKEVVIEEVIQEEYEDDFQFLDEEAEIEKKKKEKKEKKEKKQKSKEKKEKSKQKKTKKQKDSKKSSKPQTAQVQEQFQFL